MDTGSERVKKWTYIVQITSHCWYNACFNVNINTFIYLFVSTDKYLIDSCVCSHLLFIYFVFVMLSESFTLIGDGWVNLWRTQVLSIFNFLEMLKNN